jgi:hypothetical protein
VPTQPLLWFRGLKTGHDIRPYSNDGITPALTLHEFTPPKIDIEVLLVYDMAYELKVVPLSLDNMHRFFGVKSSSVG